MNNVQSIQPVKRTERQRKDRGTPETRAKLKDDFLRDIPPELQAAAQRIDEAYRLVVGALLVKTNRFERSDRTYSEDWPAELIELRKTYLDWVVELRKRKESPNLTIGIVTDRIHPAEFAYRYGLEHDHVVERLLEQLMVFNSVQASRG